jgi:hypothetical protein
MNLGEIYNDGKFSVLIIDREGDIYFIAIAMVEKRVQCPFVPVSRSILENFTDTLFPMPEKIVPSDISESKELWLKQNDGYRTFFTIPINGIWEYLVSALKKSGTKPSDFWKDSWYVLPIMFPTIKSPTEVG